MPPIGLLVGGVDFSSLRILLSEGVADAEPVAINIGVFLNNVISFLIVALAVFMMVKAINTLRRRLERGQEQAAAPAPPPWETYLKDIRDAVVKGDVEVKR